MQEVDPVWRVQYLKMAGRRWDTFLKQKKKERKKEKRVSTPKVDRSVITSVLFTLFTEVSTDVRIEE